MGSSMRHIVHAIRTTYSDERQSSAYLTSLIDELEVIVAEGPEMDLYALTYAFMDIEEAIEDIHNK